MRTRRSFRLAVAALLVAAAPLAACSDEDNDGATTDEEIQDLRDGADRAEDEVNQEIEGQDTGTNNDGE